jgi:hypothetical protein
MSRTIKAIERHMRPRPAAESVEHRSAKLVAEWQQRGPETFSGQVLRKLRLTLAPPQSGVTANAGG